MALRDFMKDARTEHGFLVYHFEMPPGGSGLFRYHKWELSAYEEMSVRQDRPVTKRQLGFLEYGHMWMDLFNGRRYEYLPSFPPRPWMFGILPGTLTATVDSLYTCITYTDSRTAHEFDRLWLKDGETYSLEDLPDDQFVYVCHGELLTSDSDVALENRRLHKFDANSPGVLTARGDVDLVYIKNPFPFVPENLDEVPAYAEDHRIW